jgi:peptidyl-prolyl cis-trans isomerase C
MRTRPMLVAAARGGLLSLPVLVGLGLACSLSGCKPAKIKATQDNSELGQVVAKVDDNVITVGDVQERINKQAPFIRSRYTTIEKKKEFLDNLIRFEVMAAEAQKRGYDKDPEVIRVMKQQMISKFLQKDFESKLKIEDVPDAEVEKYYSAHPEEFNRKDEVRVSQILVKDKAKADKVAAEVRALPKAAATSAAAAPADQQKPFRDLVTKYSEDEDSKQRAGDLTFFDKDTMVYPKPLVEAAFKLTEVGEVAGPIKSDKGYHIIKLTQKKPGFTRPLPEVKRQIQQRLFRDLRTKSMESFIAELRKKSKIDIHEDMLAKVLVDSGMNGEGGGASVAGMPPGMPGMHPQMPGAGPPGAPHSMGAMSPAGAPPPGAMPPPGAHPTSAPATAPAKHP